jgi:hypothetical protein
MIFMINVVPPPLYEQLHWPESAGHLVTQAISSNSNGLITGKKKRQHKDVGVITN